MTETVESIIRFLNLSVQEHDLRGIYYGIEKLAVSKVRLTYFSIDEFLTLNKDQPSFTLDFISLREKIREERLSAIDQKEYESAARAREKETAMDRRALQLCSQELFKNEDHFNIKNEMEVFYTLPLESELSTAIRRAIKIYFPFPRTK